MTATLYETDYYAWTLDQAERLRRLAGDNRIDAGHLAEEVEDLGKSELYSVFSFVERVLEHFLKIEFSGLFDPQRHWRLEIRGFRLRLRRRLTPSMRPKLEAAMMDIYEQARIEALKSLRADIPDAESRLPETCPYTLDQVLDPDWYPSPEDRERV
jgi:hypothetical protein